MAHYVKCIYCGNRFDRDKEEAVKVRSRYAHLDCYKEATGEVPPEYLQLAIDKENLMHYIDGLWDKKANYPLLMTQLKRYTTGKSFNYTHKGILNALKYYYEVTKHPINEEYKDLSIVPYVYTKAQVYFNRIENAQKINEDKNIKDYEQKEAKVIHIPIPQTTIKRRKLFTFFEEEE